MKKKNSKNCFFPSCKKEHGRRQAARSWLRVSTIDSYSGCGPSYYQGRVGWRGQYRDEHQPDSPGPFPRHKEEGQMVNPGEEGLPSPHFHVPLREERRQGAGHSTDCTKARICWAPYAFQRTFSSLTVTCSQQTGIPCLLCSTNSRTL